MTPSKPKVAIFSDLHLGLYGNSEQWHEIALNWADWIVEDLKKNKIKDIFFLGDFFHNRSEISVQTIHVASLILEKFRDFNMIMIVGNHDAYYKNRSDIHSLALMSAHDNITIVDELLEIEAFDKKLLFVPWNTDLPDRQFDYIFGHFEVLTFKMNNYKVCDHGIMASDLLVRSPRTYSGHFHTKSTKLYKEGFISYIGNTFHHDFNDYGDEKGYYILDLEDDTNTFCPNKVSPKFQKILASKIKQYDKTHFKNNVVKLIVDTDLDEKTVSKIQTYISKFKPFQFYTEYGTQSQSVDDSDELDSVELFDQIKEFLGNLKLDDKKSKRVEAKLKELYDKNKN